MVYIVPQLRVFQQFRPSAAGNAGPRRAHITGPHAALFRYSVAAEKLQIALGEYDHESDVDYDWPSRPVGALIDQSYAKLWLDDAKLSYYQHIGGGVVSVDSVSGRTNRVRSTTVAFADNGDAYPKSAVMLDRGAKIGDGVIVTGSDGSDDYTLETTIRGFVGETIAATLGSTDAAANNANDQSADVSIDTLGAVNAVVVEADGSGYDAMDSGYIDETYTVTVTRSSVGGDATTALLRIRSASGTDDADNVAPSAFGAPTAIGENGLEATFSLNETSSASESAEENEIDVSNLVEGQSWRFHVLQAFNEPTVSIGGTYTGPSDTTYIIELVPAAAEGGLRRFRVMTTTGIDAAAPTPVLGGSVAAPAGGYGLTFTFTAASGDLRTGDRWYATVTAQKEGAYQTLVLADDLPTELQTEDDFDLTLYYKKNIQITEDQEPNPPNVNFEMTDAELTVLSGMQVFDDAWTDEDEPAALNVIGGSLYAEYRAWLDTYTATVDYAGVDTVAEKLGTVHPDNPLAYGVFLAASNANGIEVGFTSVANPDTTDSWAIALSVLPGRTGLYSMVPLSDIPSVKSAWLGHAESESGESNKRWRRAVVGVHIDPVQAIVNDESAVDGEPVMATIVDDPDASGTQFRILIGDSRAKFLSNGVRGGDEIRYNFGTDGFGNPTYDSFTVDTVLSESTIRMTSSNPVAVSIGQKMEIWRTLTRADSPAEVQDELGNYGNRRMIAIANPEIEIDGVDYPSYFAAAAFAGLRSGVEPHRPLTRVTLTGFTGVGATASRWNGPDMDAIAAVGGLIIMQDDSGQIFIRHAVTTAGVDAGLEQFEEMFGSNLDSISYEFAVVLEPYYGRANVVPGMLTLIANVIRDKATNLTVPGDPTIGGQITSFEDPTVRASETQRDHVIATLPATLPYALNLLDLEIVV